MKKFFAVLFMAVPVVAVAADARDPRVGTTSMVNAKFAPAQNRAMIASKNQLTTPDISLSTNRSPSIKDDDVGPAFPKDTEKDKREAERAACLNNNIGIGNTFVWASRYSNTASYATMQEDTENPENNVCFVKVDLKSADSRINVSDIPSRYFQWGETINCGSWVDEEMLKQRILDAKKKGRTWATVGGAVGGAAVGVGSMELFGNKLIGGAVEGQKDLSGIPLLRSQLLTLKNKGDSRYEEFKTDLKALKTACDKFKSSGGTLPSECTEFESLMDI
ncbi:MAG: hypothetical protein J5620_04060 [Alphaproteobacteria bacterium]|nr:hypothetical protein [Alphaproteobacteria bacterium]